MAKASAGSPSSCEAILAVVYMNPIYTINAHRHGEVIVGMVKSNENEEASQR